MLAKMLTLRNEQPEGPNAKGKRRRGTEGAEGTNTGHENAEGMACVGVRLTDQLGDRSHAMLVTLSA